MKVRVLVIDDDAPLRQTLSEVLTSEGYDVACAEDGATALAAVNSEPPDLIIVDLLMPGMHGAAFVRTLRERAGNKVAVIMMTALRGWAQRDSSGADAFLEKPFSMDVLLNTIARALYRKYPTRFPTAQ